MPSIKVQNLLKILIPDKQTVLCDRNFLAQKTSFSCVGIECRNCLMGVYKYNNNRLQVVRILNE